MAKNWCFQENKVACVGFHILKYLIHISNLMTDIKADCVSAKTDSGSRTITLYKYRIFFKILGNGKIRHNLFWVKQFFTESQKL